MLLVVLQTPKLEKEVKLSAKLVLGCLRRGPTWKYLEWHTV